MFKFWDLIIDFLDGNLQISFITNNNNNHESSLKFHHLHLIKVDMDLKPMDVLIATYFELLILNKITYMSYLRNKYLLFSKLLHGFSS